MLKRLLRITLAVGAVTFVAAVVVSMSNRLPLEAPSERGILEWVGAIHVHTVASDGGGTLGEVAEAARVTGLDFVTITDHNVWAVPGPEYVAGILMVLGEEARVPSGHILVLGGDDPQQRRIRRTEADQRGSPLGSSVPAGKGLRIVAHPEGPGEPWQDWDPAGFDAIEIWNWDTELRDDGLDDWPKALLLLPAEPVSAMLELLDRPEATLARWDQLLEEGHRVPGVCAVDAHSKVPLTARLALPFPAYKDLFSLARQHVLLAAEPTGDAAHDAALVTDALRAGRSFCALDGIADASGFSAEAVNSQGTATFGGELSWEEEGVRIIASVPEIAAPTTVKLYRNGAVVSQGQGPDFDSGVLASPGAYRLEILVELGRGQVPWIFSNPIWVL